MEKRSREAADKKKPPLTLKQLLDGLARSVPGFTKDVRDSLALLDAESGGSA